MQKHEEGLSDEQLDNKIASIAGELLPKEKPENPNLQNVIVDGYIFEIDRSVPKIVDYIGPADGIIITAYVTGNDSWVKPDETVTVKGSIKKYGGGTVVSSSAIATNGVTIPTDFPTAGGSYTIPNISVDTDITITATDSDGETINKKIEVRIKRDGTPPTVETLDAKAEGLKIIFTATGHDKNAKGEEESGINYFTYTITSTEDSTLEGIPEKERTKKFKEGEKVEINTKATGDRDETTYTIKVTATDNVGNTTDSTKAKIDNIVVENSMTLAEAREKVNGTTLQQYIGTKIRDYIPIGDSNGIYRVFYFDSENDGNGNGYFGDLNTLYLKRDRDAKVSDSNFKNRVVGEEGDEIMKQMNPMLANSTYKEGIISYISTILWMCSSSQWTDFATEEAKFVIGCPSIEMLIKSHNAYYGVNLLNVRFENLSCYSTTGAFSGGGPYCMYYGMNGGEWLCSPKGFSQKYQDNDWGDIGPYVAKMNTAEITYDSFPNSSYVCPIVAIK